MSKKIPTFRGSLVSNLVQQKKEKAEDNSQVWSTEKIEEAMAFLSKGKKPPLGNPFFERKFGMRRADLVFKYTPEEIQEYKKCKSDIFYFAEKYCKIKTEKGHYTHFKLREYQQEALDIITNNKKVVYMAARQSGKSIMTAISFLHYVCFNTEKNVLVVANKGDTAKEVLLKMKEIYTRLPFFLQPGIENWAVNSISFDNDNYIQAIATTSTPAIGFTIDYLYIDEFAYIPPNIASLFWKSIIPTMDAVKTSKMVITSTPNGMNLFYDIYNAAEKNLNGFIPIKTYWHEVPNRDNIWKEEKIAELGNGNYDLGVELFNQEYDIQFITNSILLIDNNTLGVLDSAQINFEHQVIDNLEDAELEYSTLKWHPDFDDIIFDKYDKRFLLSIDLGYGMLQDYSVINIFEMTTLNKEEIENMKNAKSELDYAKLRQIGIFKSNDQEPKEVAQITMELVKFLGIDNALINFEVNAAGDYYYKCLEEDEEFFNDLVVQTHHSKVAKIQKPGVKTTNQKVNYCKELKNQLRYGQVEVYEWDTIEELKVFGMNKDKTSYEAMKGHDDIVMSMVINMGIKQSFNYTEFLSDVLDMYNKEELDLIYEKLSMSENSEMIDYENAFDIADRYIGNEIKSENPLSGFNKTKSLGY